MPVESAVTQNTVVLGETGDDVMKQKIRSGDV